MMGTEGSMSMGIKPCPFCGGGAHILKIPSRRLLHYSIRCNSPLCIGFAIERDYRTAEEAVEAWNRRAERTGTYYKASSIDTGAISFQRLFCSECWHQLPGASVKEGEHYMLLPKYPIAPIAVPRWTDGPRTGRSMDKGRERHGGGRGIAS